MGGRAETKCELASGRPGPPPPLVTRLRREARRRGVPTCAAALVQYGAMAPGSAPLAKWISGKERARPGERVDVLHGPIGPAVAAWRPVLCLGAPPMVFGVSRRNGARDALFEDTRRKTRFWAFQRALICCNGSEGSGRNRHRAPATRLPNMVFGAWRRNGARDTLFEDTRRKSTSRAF